MVSQLAGVNEAGSLLQDDGGTRQVSLSVRSTMTRATATSCMFLPVYGSQIRATHLGLDSTTWYCRLTIALQGISCTSSNSISHVCCTGFAFSHLFLQCATHFNAIHIWKDNGSRSG